jgi:hypothetical protein
MHHTFTRTHLRITAALAFLALCAIGGYAAVPSSHLPASCFTDDNSRCLSEWGAAR